MSARTRPGHPRSRGLVHRGTGHDFIAHFQRHAAPAGASALHVGTIDKIADADHRTDSVVGEPLQVVDEVLAREHLLRHPAVGEILKAEMAVEIDERRHDGLAGKIDARAARG